MCPYLEKSDARCAQHLSLHRIDDALGVCAAEFECCPIYRQKMLRDVNRPRQYEPALAG